MMEKKEKKTKVFAVLKYNTFAFGNQSTTYEKAYSAKNERDGIKRSEAKELIEKYNMVKVHEDENGTIWEMPGNPFYKKFNAEVEKQKNKEENKKRMDRRKRQIIAEKKKAEYKVKKLQEIKEEIKNGNK